MLVHDTTGYYAGNESQLERDGFDVVEYETPSAHGQTLEAQTLRNGGRYTVSTGQGASEFTYPAPEELAELGYETAE